MDDHRRERLAKATSSLQSWLDPLTFTDLHRRDVTALLTEQVVLWGRAHRFVIRQQVPSTATRLSRRGHPWPGVLDLACIHASGQNIAIEIDAGNKTWSIQKLAAEAQAGRLAIWVKWGGPVDLTLVPDTIGLVEVRAERTRRGNATLYRRVAHAKYLRTAEDELASAHLA
jgi:hypothetical protein